MSLLDSLSQDSLLSSVGSTINSPFSTFIWTIAIILSLLVVATTSKDKIIAIVHIKVENGLLIVDPTDESKESWDKLSKSDKQEIIEYGASFYMS